MNQNTKERNLKIIKNMTLMDDIFMAVFFRDRPDCVEDILNVILPFSVTVESVKTNYKHSSSNSHSVIFDIFAKDSENKIYDIEIQKRSDGASQRRARFYSSVLDIESMNRGQEYDEIADTYVIFITEYDVLKGKKPIYLIERTILDFEKTTDKNIHIGQSFDDGSHIIYFNTSYNGECDEKIKDLIHDFRCSEPDYIRNKNLSERFKELKNDSTKKEVDDMCELLENIMEEERIKARTEGLAEGLAEGHSKGLAEGHSKGLAEGHSKGLAEGHSKGLAEGNTKGRTEKAIEIAKNMLLSGKLPVEMIAEFCNLTVEEVNELKKSA